MFVIAAINCGSNSRYFLTYNRHAVPLSLGRFDACTLCIKRCSHNIRDS
jgi:hypothetical protein